MSDLRAVQGTLYSVATISMIVLVAQISYMIIPQWQLIDVANSDEYLQVGLWSVCLVKPSKSGHTECFALGDFNKAYIAKKRSFYRTDGDNNKTVTAIRSKRDVSDARKKPRKIAKTKSAFKACNRTEMLSNLTVSSYDNSTVLQCPAAYDYNKNVTTTIGYQTTRKQQEGASEQDSFLEATYSICDARSAPLVTGATFTNDTLYGHTHVHYSCIPGYVQAIRYSNDVFCKCSFDANGTKSETNCSWTTPPECIPDDSICLLNGLNSDVCTVGDRKIVLGEGLGTVNKDIGIDIPQANFPTNLYVFPHLTIECGGDLRQWDLVATALPGSFYIDVWRWSADRTALELVSSRQLSASSPGLQSFLLKSEERVVVHPGDMVGVHFYNTGDFNASVIFARNDSDIQADDPSVWMLPWNHTQLTTNNMKPIRFDKFQILSIDDYFYPAIMAYITIGESVPLKVSVVQALPIISTLSSALALAALGYSIILWLQYNKALVMHNPNDQEGRDQLADSFFQKVTRYLHTAIMCFLLAGIAQLDCFALFFQLYNCNQSDQWRMGLSGYILLISGIIGICLVVLICVAERRLILFISTPKHLYSEALPYERKHADRQSASRPHSRTVTPALLKDLTGSRKSMPAELIKTDSSASIDNLKVTLIKT